MEDLLSLSVMERRGDYSEQFALTDKTPRVLDPKGGKKSFQPDMIKILFSCWDDTGWKASFVYLGGKLILADGTVGKKRQQLDYTDPLDPEHVEEDRAPEWVRTIAAARLALLRGEAAPVPRTTMSGPEAYSRALQCFAESDQAERTYEYDSPEADRLIRMGAGYAQLASAAAQALAATGKITPAEFEEWRLVAGTPKSLTGQPRTIAYMVGSMWYCVEHGEDLDGAVPVHEGNTHPVYAYRCDHCKKLLQPQLERDEALDD